MEECHGFCGNGVRQASTPRPSETRTGLVWGLMGPTDQAKQNDVCDKRFFCCIFHDFLR